MSFKVIQRSLFPLYKETVLKENIPTYEEARLFIEPLYSKYYQEVSTYLSSNSKAPNPRIWKIVKING